MKEDDDKDSIWSVAQWQIDEQVIFARIRTGIDPNGNRLLSTVVEIIWPVESPSSEYPSESEQAEMDEFEDVLDPLFNGEQSSILTHVLTGEGKRVWIVYATSLPSFMKAFNSLLRTSKTYPIEIRSGMDPNWNEYKAALGVETESYVTNKG